MLIIEPRPTLPHFDIVALLFVERVPDPDVTLHQLATRIIVSGTSRVGRLGAAGTHRAGLCAGPRQPDGREEALGLGANRGARAVCRPVDGLLPLLPWCPLRLGCCSDRRQRSKPGCDANSFCRMTSSGGPLREEVSESMSLDFLHDDMRLPRRFFSARWRGYWYMPDGALLEIHGAGDDWLTVHVDGGGGAAPLPAGSDAPGSRNGHARGRRA